MFDRIGSHAKNGLKNTKDSTEISFPKNKFHNAEFALSKMT
jgi:hypothetical protein